MNLKQLLPTLLPLAGTVVLAVAPVVQHALTGFVVAHPVLAGVFTTLSLVVNHWLPSPGANAAS